MLMRIVEIKTTFLTTYASSKLEKIKNVRDDFGGLETAIFRCETGNMKGLIKGLMYNYAVQVYS